MLLIVEGTVEVAEEIEGEREKMEDWTVEPSLSESVSKWVLKSSLSPSLSSDEESSPSSSSLEKSRSIPFPGLS